MVFCGRIMLIYEFKVQELCIQLLFSHIKMRRETIALATHFDTLFNYFTHSPAKIIGVKISMDFSVLFKLCF